MDRNTKNLANPSGPSGESRRRPRAPGGAGAGREGGRGRVGEPADALRYLIEIRNTFVDEREKYDMFLGLVRDHGARRINTTHFITRIKIVFNGHPNLILGLNAFLPDGYQITLDDEEVASKRVRDYEEAAAFVYRVKQRFGSNSHIYKSFLDNFDAYGKGNMDLDQLHQQIVSLFEGHTDLLSGFQKFMPGG